MKTSSILTLMLGLVLTGFAQKQSGTVVIKRFSEVCRIYQQLPLYLRVEIQASSNLPLQPDDTAASSASFYLKGEESYVRYGDFEQLVNDSMALLVSNNMQRMILYPEAAPVLAQLRNQVGGQVSSGSVDELGKKYTAEQTPSNAGLTSIVLSAKESLHGTAWSNETIELLFDPATNQPVQITATKRNLLPLDESFYQSIKERPELKDHFFQVQNDRTYLVRERRITFQYKDVNHDPNLRLPASMKDRIVRDASGAFTPLKNYEAYTLTIN